MGIAKQWPRRDKELIAEWIEVIDRGLRRFFDELPQMDLKTADYLKLTELNLLSAHEGGKKVVVRWVNCEEKGRETNGQEEDE